MSFEFDQHLRSVDRPAAGGDRVARFAKLDAKTTRRCARSFPDSYIDSWLVATRYAPVPVVFVVVLPLTVWKQYSTRNAQNTKVARELCQNYNRGPSPAAGCEAWMSHMTFV
jgi:hypothetical protein